MHGPYPTWETIDQPGGNATVAAAAELLQRGSFAYHWHNSKRGIEPGSWLAAFLGAFERPARLTGDSSLG